MIYTNHKRIFTTNTVRFNKTLIMEEGEGINGVEEPMFEPEGLYWNDEDKSLPCLCGYHAEERRWKTQNVQWF